MFQWKETDANQLMDSKLKCVFVMPDLDGAFKEETQDNKTAMHPIPPSPKVSWMKLLKVTKTGVINDPLGQTHSLASSEHCFRLKFVLLARFLNVGTYVRIDNMGENNDHYWPRL